MSGAGGIGNEGPIITEDDIANLCSVWTVNDQRIRKDQPPVLSNVDQQAGEPDFWDDFNCDPALENARAMAELAASLQNRLRLLEQMQQDHTDRDLRRSDVISEVLRNFARTLSESRQRLVGCTKPVDVDGFTSEVKIMFSQIEVVCLMLEVALAGKDLKPLQQTVFELLTRLQETLRFASRLSITETDVEEMLELSARIERIVEAVLDLIGNRDFSSDSVTSSYVQHTVAQLDTESHTPETIINTVQSENKQLRAQLAKALERLRALDLSRGVVLSFDRFFSDQITKLIHLGSISYTYERSDLKRNVLEPLSSQLRGIVGQWVDLLQGIDQFSSLLTLFAQLDTELSGLIILLNIPNNDYNEYTGQLAESLQRIQTISGAIQASPERATILYASFD